MAITTAADIASNKRQKVEDSTHSTTTATNTSTSTNSNDTESRYNYQGFSFQTKDNTTSSSGHVDSIAAATRITGRDFFDRYIAPRKPCVLEWLPEIPSPGVTEATTTTATAANCDTERNQSPPSNKLSKIHITKELLENVAGNERIQVERRKTIQENFGQNRTSSRQIVLTIAEFLRRMSSQSPPNRSSVDQNGDPEVAHETSTRDDDGSLLYWSTQEDTDDPFNVPCRQLVDRNLIPSHLDLAGHLILSSCNLWVGKTRAATTNTNATTNDNVAGASSGLHHDYHDNFYLLLRGRKRFRLFSPDCAPHLAVWGTIDCIHPNGRVSYVGNETRADGVPLEELKGHHNDNELGEDTGEDDDDDDNEEELVLGKGFDYVSDDEDDEGFVEDTDQKDDFDALVEAEQSEESEKNKIAVPTSFTNETNDGVQNEHPDSFSRINPCRTDRDALLQEFPSFASCKEVIVEINAGQMLFLPAGWFHEVTSYSTIGDEDDPLGDCHMALNYWYHPLDAPDNYRNPYQDDFWKKEEEQRLKKAGSKAK